MKYLTILAATAALGLAGAAQAQAVPPGGGVVVGGSGAGDIGVGPGGVGAGGAAGGAVALPDTASDTVEEAWDETETTAERGLDNVRTQVEQAEAEGERGLDRADEVQDTEADGKVRLDTPAGAANANVHAGDHPAGETPDADDGETTEN